MIKNENCPNFGYPKGTQGRNGQKVEAIIDHVSGGYWDSNYSWIMNPGSSASYNYYVRLNGQIIRFVDDNNAAYSNGAVHNPTWSLLKKGVNPNLYTLSICREGHNHEKPTEEQYKSILFLHKEKIKKFNIPIDREHITGHFVISSHRYYCPGSGFPWETLFADLLDTKKDELPWQKRQAIEAILSLAEKGRINNSEIHINNVLKDKPLDPYVLFSLFDRHII